jgi:hypothetical protein
MSHNENQQPTHLAITLTPSLCACGKCRQGAHAQITISTPNKSTELSEFLDQDIAKHLFSKMMELAGTGQKMCDEMAPKNRAHEAEKGTTLSDVLADAFSRARAAATPQQH